MAWIGKKYKLKKSENFDEYMKALGVGLILRKIGNTVSPFVELVKDGDTYTFKTSSTFKSSEIQFNVGKEFEEETLDGRKIKTVCKFEGDNKWIQEQKGDKPTTIIREFTDTELVATMSIDGVTCTRTYKAV